MPSATKLTPDPRYYNGDEATARSLVASLYDLGPIDTKGGMVPYTAVTDIYSQFEMQGFDRFASSSVHIDYPVSKPIVLSGIKQFTDAVARQDGKFQPSMLMLDIRDYRKVASVPRDATIYSHRYNAALFMTDFRWDDPGLDGVARREAKTITTSIKEMMKEEGKAGKVKVNGGRDVEAVYPNIGGKDEKLESVYGANLARARELKRKVDPGLLFDKWYPITPA